MYSPCLDDGIHPFNRYLVNTYVGPGTVLGAK